MKVKVGRPKRTLAMKNHLIDKNGSCRAIRKEKNERWRTGRKEPTPQRRRTHRLWTGITFRQKREKKKRKALK